MIGGSEENYNPNSIDNDDSEQHDSSALEYTIDCMAKTTNDGGSGGFCPDPRHNHSFRSVPFIMLPVYSCAGCGQRLQPYVVGSSLSKAAVQCMACGVYAHRRCAFSKHIEWQTKCAKANFEERATPSLNAIDDAEIEESTSELDNTIESEASDQSSTEQVRKNFLNSIFRGESKEVTKSLDGGNLRGISASASVDNACTNTTAQNDFQRSKANFPFLSSVSLLPSHNTSMSAREIDREIRQCQTWNGVVKTPSTPDASAEQVASESKVEESKGDSDDVIDPKSNQDSANTENASTAPLHFASHGFQVVSQALQENIMVHFEKLIPKENSKTHSDAPEQPDGSNTPDLEKDHSSSVMDTESPEPERSKGEEVGDENDGVEARGLLETSEPKKESAVDKKHIGLATVAGTIVGGVIGVGLAGPVGGVIGVKCGQTAGLLGLLLEGSVTASVLASGIGVGLAAGQHIQDQHETRVLALGEGTKQRALLMVRPTIQAPEPIWDELYQQARRSYSGNNTNIVEILLPNESRAAKRDRYEREVDIVETGEDELAIADKVLLLASRILSNKESLPGHVYRKLIEAFRCRCSELNLRDLQMQHQKRQRVGSSTDDPSPSRDDSSTSIEKDDDDDDEKTDELFLRTHQRRRDAHAVIKYVTTSLLLTRPGFGHSSSLTEQTATAVESLVFGEIYDLVMEEIEMEYQNSDDLLLDKIADFDRKQGQRDDFSMSASKDSCFGYKSCISEEALGALHCLPQAHSAVDKLRYCVVFLEQISEKFSKSDVKSAMGADSLLKMVCQHILLAKVIGINSQIAFLEEFARDEQLLRGREGYALVTLQASLHFLNASTDFESDIFNNDED